MATSISPSSSVAGSPTGLGHLANFTTCPYTFLVTKVKQTLTRGDDYLPNTTRPTVPRACLLRKMDNSIAIYALVDPIDTDMTAADVCINLLVEQLSQISFDDDSYKDKISHCMQQIPYETDNRLLQMIFDRAEAKATGNLPLGLSTEKCLPTLDEAQSGAFIFAATVTQSNVYVSYVGTIRAFLISNKNGELGVYDDDPQYYRTGSLHLLDNDDESLRLRNLNVNLDQARRDGLDNSRSKFTRCIGKLSEKLLSSSAAANDVYEARCNALVCEPKCHTFKILPHYCALVVMTEKVFDMYLKAGIPEEMIPSHFVGDLRGSMQSTNPAERILSSIEDLYRKTNEVISEDIVLKDMGLLIHFFHQPKGSNQQLPFVVKQNTIRRLFDGEVTIDEVKRFIIKNNEIQQTREKNRLLSRSTEHKREVQSQINTVEPFVRFDIYEKLLSDNKELRDADKFITDLLYTQSASSMDEKLNKYLNDHPTLSYD